MGSLRTGQTKVTRQLESSLVRIYSNDQRIVGTGFLLTDRQVITCVHVIARALGLSGNEPEAPHAEVCLDFPLIQAENILIAQVRLWQPTTDIAGLELVNAPPAGVQPACLVRAEDLWGHTFRAFGFPSGYETGVWVSGVLRGRQADGWIQIEDVKQTGYFVQPGFSGAPVWDDELSGVVGMIVAADTTPGVRAAFLIPTEMLVSIWPQVKLKALLDAKEVRTRPSVVNLPPLDMTHTFKDRQREIQALRDYLADERVRLVSIVGRGGWGKTALACHVLADLQKNMLLDLSEGREHPINGILYLGARTTGLGLERIYADVGRMLGEPAAGKLAARWTHGDTSLTARVGYLLEAMQGGLYLILLDNMEDLLTEEGEVTDEGLRLFVERCLLQPSGARLIATSRQEIRLPAAALPRVRNIPMDEGLPDDDASALLHELDPQNELGLRDASQEDLQHAVRLTQGIPRALELVAGILDHDPTANLPWLLADERLFGEEIVDTLVAGGYSRLEDGDRRIMEALAVFDRPVEMQAIVYLLQPWFPDLDVRDSLRRLVGSYFARANRFSGEYSLHPLDRKYAYRQLPSSEGADAYNQRNLDLRAADHYANVRKPESEWKTMDDLAPQLSEFKHRVGAGDYDGACQILDLIDHDYLHPWGFYSLLADLREKLRDQPMAIRAQATNLSGLGRAYRALGQNNDAVGCYEIALALARDIGDRRMEGAQLGSLGNAYFALGEVAKATGLLEEALAITREIGDREGEGKHLSNLGFIYRLEGHIDQAIRFSEEAIDIFSEIGYRRGKGSRLGNLASANRDIGQFQQAIQLYKESLLSAKELGYRREEGVQLANLGDIYCELGQTEKAIELYEQALSIAREIGYRGGEQRYVSRLGHTHEFFGQVDLAIECYEAALAIANELEDPRGKSHQLLRLSHALLAKGQFSKAAECSHNSRDIEQPETNYRAALLLGIAQLNEHGAIVGDAFRDAAARCQSMLDKTADLCRPRYTLATALVGAAICSPHWANDSKHDELLSSAFAEYRLALKISNAKGVVQDALWHLEMIQTAGIDRLEPIFELLNSALVQNRSRGCALGAAIGDALGMPLEFGPRRTLGRLVRSLEPGRLPAGTFTDDTEMALALADSLLAYRPLDPADLAQRFAAWLQAGPDDVGIHTRKVLSCIADGQPWEEAVDAVQRQNPDSAGNGSVMRCWPVALAHWDDLDQLLADSRLQSRVTHPHPECEAGSTFVNAIIYYLLNDATHEDAVAQALDAVDNMPAPLRAVIEQAPTRKREELQNSGWVRHTLESAVWGLLTTDTFEDAVVQVVNLGNDADTAGAVVGALAGAAYGIDAIPLRWREALQGEWPLRSGTRWKATDLISLAERLIARRTDRDERLPQRTGG
jgi:ADP-ribosyl-[dinitrogen reductase] hydrolase